MQCASVTTMRTKTSPTNRCKAAAAPRARAAPVGSYDDDNTLIRRVAAQDHQAFTVLYQRYASRLLGYLVQLLRRRELAEEVLNDVMVVVWFEMPRFRHTSRLSTWMFGIAYHKALKALIKAGEPVDKSLDAHVSMSHQAPEDTMVRQETSKALAYAVQALPPEQRAVVELACYDGLCYRDIAELLGCPVNTVKARMLYARRRLAQLLPRQQQYV